MKNDERAEKLKALQEQLRNGALRSDLHKRRDLLGQIVALLNYNSLHHGNAMTAGDVLSQPGFSSDMYERMEGRIDLIVAQAIVELSQNIVREARGGSKIFIGHGRSTNWKDLKDFIHDRLHLEWDEFNRVPIAGIQNIVRLSQMLDDAAIALLVLTAEDEQVDGRMHARMNVIHEAGLFQGRLGFEKAILLVEEGCEEFSNVQGLGQIRFSRGKISETFEEIRRVMEREGFISAAGVIESGLQ